MTERRMRMTTGRTAGAGRRTAAARPDEPPFEISARVADQARTHGATRPRGAPHGRPLRIYTLDPSLSFRLGGIATVTVPFEPLAPGPKGALFELVPDHAPRALGVVEPLDLDDPRLLMTSGLSPTPANGQFHLQMAYAVCSLTYAYFRRALGRDLAWAVSARADHGPGPVRLKVWPFALREDNAYYDRDEGGISFGHFRAGEAPAGHTVPKGLIFTGLSHDVLVHETTHALLDALRAEFYQPTESDVVGFHEGFADIVALFQHFSYPEVVEHALRESRGSLRQASLLSDIAREFGYATTSRKDAAPLRTAVDVDDIAAFDSDAFLPSGRGPKVYRPGMEEHDMGSVLVSAVFEAFTTVFRRRTGRLFRIAGVDPSRAGEVPPGDDLLAALAREASDVAARFLDICIRAIDYCPPVDMEMGEYLRALITADSDLVGEDPWGYREALMRSFRRRRMFPDHVEFMTEDAVKWQSPPSEMVIPELAFRRLRFDGEPGRPADARELTRQARAIGRFVTDPAHAGHLHLVAPGAALPKGMTYANVPRVESVRCARRAAPDGRILFDLVAEVIQTGRVVLRGTEFDFAGGCTLVIDPDGRVRFAIFKKLDSVKRMARQQAAIRGRMKRYWKKQGRVHRPAPGMLRRLHERRR